MRALVLPLSLGLMIGAFVQHAQAQPHDPRAVVAAKATYVDDTIHMSWVMLDYLHRCILSNGQALERLYPGAKPMSVFLSNHLSGKLGQLAYVSIRFRKGSEGAFYKYAKDPEARLHEVSGWLAKDIHAVAAVAEAAILRHIEVRDRTLEPSRLADAWAFTKQVTGDPLVPHEEAAAVSQRFLTLTRDARVLNTLPPELKLEITDWKIKFQPGKLPGFKLDNLINYGRLTPDQIRNTKRIFEDKIRAPYRLQPVGP